MHASIRRVRMVGATLALSLTLAGPLVAVAAPRSFQEPTPTATPIAGPDLAVGMSAPTQQMRVGDTFVLTVPVTNTGILAADQIELLVKYPAFLAATGELESPKQAPVAYNDEAREVSVAYSSQAVGEVATLKLNMKVMGESGEKNDPNNLITATVATAGDADAKNNKATLEILAGSAAYLPPSGTATPPPSGTASPSPSATTSPSPSATTLPSPTSSPGTTPTPTAAPSGTPTPTTAPTLPTVPTDPTPTAEPSVPAVPTSPSGAQIDVSMQVAPNPGVVDGEIVVQTVLQNVGSGTAGSVRLTHVLPVFLEPLSFQSSHPEKGTAQLDDGNVIVIYENVAQGETITTQIITRATMASGPAGDPANETSVMAFVDKRPTGDDLAFAEVMVNSAAVQQPGATKPTPGKATPQPSAAPTATPVPPRKLPDTGTSSPGGMPLVWAAGTLLAGGSMTRLVLRRRR